MLFISKPVANKNNVFYYKNYRFSVILENVIRIEYDSKKTFNDEITQFAFVRDFGECPVNVEENDKFIIKTNTYTLVFDKDVEHSYIQYQNKKLKINNSQNLKGTYGTIDGMNGDKIIYEWPGSRKICDGVCSRNGVAVIDDSDSYCLNDKYEFTHKNTDKLDIYVFFYPNDYFGAINALFKISNYPPLIPKYAFGNWWSRYHAYTQESYLYLMKEFRDEGMPFTVATLDMDWHYSNARNGCDFFRDIGRDPEEFKDPKTGQYYVKSWNFIDPVVIGWTGYSWNKKLFPDYLKLLKDLKDINMHITLNLHPADGMGFYEDLYDDLNKDLDYKYQNNETIPFDLTDEKNREMWFKDVFAKYQNDGVDFWWIDWQQGGVSNLEGLTPMWLCNHYFYLDNYKYNHRPLILSRFAGVGSHRYPLGFSGDSFQTYDSLRYLIKTTPMASNVGFTYWSHDIGGHMHGFKDGELFLKFIQFGVFSPINRLHCSCNEVFDKNPLLFLKGYRDMIKHYLRLRHRMIPFIYSQSYQTAYKGRPLLTAIYYHIPNSGLSYQFSDTEYMFGDSLLVRPFSSKAVNGFNTFKIYFPGTNYYDLFYGYKYQAEGIYKLYRENESMPLFIKEGAFFILDHQCIDNSINNPKAIDVYTTVGNGHYSFYENIDELEPMITEFNNIDNGDNQEIHISFSGNLDIYQKDRTYYFKVVSSIEGEIIDIKNATLLETHNCGGYFEFIITDVSKSQEVIIKYRVKQESEFDVIKRNVIKRLNYIDDVNDDRDGLYNELVASNNIDELKRSLVNSKLKTINIKALSEFIH